MAPPSAIISPPPPRHKRVSNAALSGRVSTSQAYEDVDDGLFGVNVISAHSAPFLLTSPTLLAVLPGMASGPGMPDSASKASEEAASVSYEQVGYEDTPHAREQRRKLAMEKAAQRRSMQRAATGMGANMSTMAAPSATGRRDTNRSTTSSEGYMIMSLNNR